MALSNPWTVTGSGIAISAPTYDWERQGTPMNEGLLGDPAWRPHVHHLLRQRLPRPGLQDRTADLHRRQRGTEDWIVYHANSSPTQGCGSTRTTRIQKISWNAGGTPNLGVPVSTSTVLAPPCGEPSGPTVPVNRLQSYNFADRYIRHSNSPLRLDPIATATGRADATFRVTGTG
ncbi:family 43 glycosylhydrolase [Phytohabitans sp. ZYX-F-186]|uniref:Family 43 glycosylhydrolase n=1 Tax=Phytohabitans maris TaxID=3071409 RepID=A0ABU0ZRX5_9ACTN|nr:family 43 glycosylhydrolase [Phytohabitans sp. ZYX-F-186]MDQ7909781.1 family 43 glycosylhydrolase [Phytohabitans sp. ZYX-F-186]